MSKARVTNWDHPAQASILLVSGPEDFLASRVIRNLKNSARKANSQVEISEIDAGEYEAGRLIESTAPSLFGEPRLVIISGVERCTDSVIEDGIAYLGEPDQDSVVVFRHSSGVRGKKLLEALRSNEAVQEITCDKITKEADRITFVAGEFKTLGVSATHSAVRQLVSIFGEDLAGLASACLQLTQDSTEQIDDSTVDKYFGGRVEVNNFQMIDAAVAGDSQTAMALLRQTFENGVDPINLVGAVAHRFRTLAKVINNRSITAAQLGVQGWQLDRARKELVGWTEAGMARVIEELAQADAAGKGAERDPKFAMERLILLICHRGVELG